MTGHPAINGSINDLWIPAAAFSPGGSSTRVARSNGTNTLDTIAFPNTTLGYANAWVPLPHGGMLSDLYWRFFFMADGSAAANARYGYQINSILAEGEDVLTAIGSSGSSKSLALSAVNHGLAVLATSSGLGDFLQHDPNSAFGGRLIVDRDPANGLDLYTGTVYFLGAQWTHLRSDTPNRYL